MGSELMLSGITALIVVSLIIAHLSLRKSIAKDAREVAGQAYDLYLEKEWEEELIVEDPRLVHANRINDRFDQHNDTRRTLCLSLHQEKMKKRNTSGKGSDVAA